MAVTRSAARASLKASGDADKRTAKNTQSGKDIPSDAQETPVVSNPIEVAPGDEAYKIKDKQPLCEDDKSKDGEETDSLVIIPDILLARLRDR